MECVLVGGHEIASTRRVTIWFRQSHQNTLVSDLDLHETSKPLCLGLLVHAEERPRGHCMRSSIAEGLRVVYPLGSGSFNQRNPTREVWRPALGVLY